MCQSIDFEFVLTLVDSEQDFVLLNKLAGATVRRLVSDSTGNFRRERNLSKRNDGTVPLNCHFPMMLLHCYGFDQRQRLFWPRSNGRISKIRQRDKPGSASTQNEQRNDDSKGDIDGSWDHAGSRSESRSNVVGATWRTVPSAGFRDTQPASTFAESVAHIFDRLMTEARHDTRPRGLSICPELLCVRKFQQDDLPVDGIVVRLS